MRRARPWTLVAAVVFVVVWGLTTHGKYSSTGDEPHYLIVAESLVSDGDLDLANNYAHDDGRLFGHAGLVNDGHARPNAAGRLESVHDIGLAVALAPPYLVAKHLSALVPDDVLRRFRMTHGLFTYSDALLYHRHGNGSSHWNCPNAIRFGRRRKRPMAR